MDAFRPIRPIISSEDDITLSQYRLLLRSDHVPYDAAELRSYARRVRRERKLSYRALSRVTGVPHVVIWRICQHGRASWFNIGHLLMWTGADERVWSLVFGTGVGAALYRSAQAYLNPWEGDA